MEQMHKRQYRGAQFYFKSRESTDGLVERYHILLEDADGVDVNYVVTDLLNSSKTHVHETIVSDRDTEEIITNEYLRNKIITFLNNYLGD